MQNQDKIKKLRVFAEEIRLETLKEFQALGFGHVGGSMSIVETLAVLYGDVMRIDPLNPTLRTRDFLVVSKGHAGPSVYATLGLKGYFPVEDILTLNKPHTNFPSHTDRLKTPGIDMTTGSLGQGVSSACGIAIANKIDKLDSKTFVFVGDGELNEGQCWEAVQFAVHHNLDRLTFLIDNNKKQLDGTCEEIMKTFDIAEKFTAFGCHTQKVDGHNIEALLDVIENANLETQKPSCIVLDTKKGNGCTYAEFAEKNHSSQPTKEQALESVIHAEKVLAEARNA